MSSDISSHIKCTVTDASTGKPVAWATVSIIGLSPSSANTAKGEVVRLKALKSGYEPKDQDHPAGEVPTNIETRRK